MSIIQVFIAAHGNSQANKAILHLSKGELNLFEQLSTFYNIDLNFLLLVLAVMLIAGAGNVINDYFDVKADRVNKPERLIIDKHIKRRWAIMFNWIFNIIGLFITFYLSWISHNWLILIIAFVIINFLWFYSAIYKRKLFVGNILVALMVGIVPLYVLIYNLPLDGYNLAGTSRSGVMFISEVVVMIAIIAFVINFLREIIKDIADIRGDLHLSARTIPIALGIKKTKIILVIVLVPLLFLMAFYLYNIYFYDNITVLRFQMAAPDGATAFNTCVIASMLAVIIGYLILLTTNKRKYYLLSSNFLKIAMMLGMLSPLFL
ncbi:MAG: geranylgeranylglycerol-phosphate geranylgeranyltransferase [Crocinitomicaceae bacterium]